MEEREVVQRLLRVTPSKFNAFTLSLEQYNNLDKINLDEVIGSLTIHELWLKEQESQGEDEESSSSCKEVDTMAAAKVEVVAIVDIHLLTTKKSNLINFKFNVTIARSMTLCLKVSKWKEGEGRTGISFILSIIKKISPFSLMSSRTWMKLHLDLSNSTIIQRFILKAEVIF
ncbi:unnamed protein product [Spirodela intermedia]|uniref:Uncharacterized protein n=1 Tax=Spirodela intermedia TaxID=51605 RepID=A0A7I8IC99_SPIIN|nr:unnamed protein product [Spirodela intermedia]CAA6655417.1 unnamed protein product [Spirodela intermedia]